MHPPFRTLTSAELREWVEANPERVNEWDRHEHTPLFSAVRYQYDFSLVIWLLDDMSADVNGSSFVGATPLHAAHFCDIISALLDRAADPTALVPYYGVEVTALVIRVATGNFACAVRLPQDQRVRSHLRNDVDAQSRSLNLACLHNNEREAWVMIQLLLQAGGIPNRVNQNHQMPLDVLRELNPSHHTIIALLEQYPEAQMDAQTASFLVKARRLFTLAKRNATVVPSHLQSRVAQGLPLPRVTLPRTLLPRKAKNGSQYEDGEESRKLRIMLAFVCGMGGGAEGEGMPRDVFRVVMDLLMPSWDPLRRGVVGEGGIQLE